MADGDHVSSPKSQQQLSLHGIAQSQDERVQFAQADAVKIVNRLWDILIGSTHDSIWRQPRGVNFGTYL